MLVRFYDYTNYDASGSTLTWVEESGYTCSAAYSPIEFTSYWLGASGWNNRVSSVHTYNSCDVRLWDEEGASGAVSTWIDNSANLASVGTGWSNRAGSYQIS